MSIADGRFAAELISKKGRCFKFDDLQCLIDYKKEKSSTEFKAIYVNDFEKNNELIDAAKAYFVHHEELRSPMGGNFAAFTQQDKAIQFAKARNSLIQTWQEISE